MLNIFDLLYFWWESKYYRRVMQFAALADLTLLNN